MASRDDRLRRLLDDELGDCSDDDVEQRLDELLTLRDGAFTDGDTDHVQTLSALASDTRYRLVRLLVAAGRELCVCELTPLFDVSESALSHALSELIDTDLVTRRKSGRWHYYGATDRAERLRTALAVAFWHPPKIGFVCVQNAGRSQMATTFAEREIERRGFDAELVTGGTEPASQVHESVVATMAERDFDLSSRTPREITFEELETCDYVITIGCSAADVCPATWTGESRDWNLDDPDGESPERVREIRDEIRGRVRSLFDELERERPAEFKQPQPPNQPQTPN